MNAPERVGKYQIVRRLGKSMSDVYLAVDVAQNRQAALKVIRPDGTRTTRLVLEAERRGAAIQKDLHALDPRMVEIYDFGDADGYFYVAMQYVEGRSLADVLGSEEALDPHRAATVALEICELLAKFHTAPPAVVHGDIKPSNIHIGWNDTVRLLDFGIAKTLRAGGDATTHHFGSPGYCSPERLTRSEVDQQSDLWSVGATLYEMLAGKPPYQAESTSRLESLIRSRRPPRALPAGCPRSLRAVVNKALAPSPAKRYQTAREFQADLQAFLAHRPTLAEAEQRGWAASATMEVARECVRKATRTARRAQRQFRVMRMMAQAAGPAAWFATGMVLWIGGTVGIEFWQAHRAKPAPPAVVKAETVPPPVVESPALYAAAADRILDSFRHSPEPSLHEYDWQQAEAYLERAVRLGSNDDATLGKLALARGYGSLERLNGEAYSDPAAARLRKQARDQFEIAAKKMPADPEPHLGLARVYVYSLPNVEKAMAEFASAALLGAVLSRREIEQEADAYRIRAELHAAASPQLARQDVQTARSLYQRIAGYNRVDEHLRGLESLEASMRGVSRKARRWR